MSQTGTSPTDPTRTSPQGQTILAGVPNLPDRATARLLGDLFRASGLTQQRVMEVFGIREAAQFQALPPQIRISRTAEPNALNTFIRLFLMGLEVPAEQARAALGSLPLETLVQGDVLEMLETRVRAVIQLDVHDRTYTASDMPARAGGTPADTVMAVVGTTLLLSDVSLRKSFGEALDLGCGTGYLALRASPHCQHVTAVDKSQRSVAFARFNADLNGIENIDALAGDLFEPVKGKTFDFIFCNPPFAISPDSSYLYRDSGMRGDEFCQRIVREAPEHLNPGGWMQMLCEWTHIKGVDPRQRLASWFATCGSDVLVQRFRTVDPLSYAMEWLGIDAREGRIANQAQLNESVKRWIESFRAMGIEGISRGLITMRKLDPWELAAGRQPWIRTDDAPDRLQSPAGHQIERVFKNQDFLNGCDDRKFLAARFKAAPEIRIRQELAPGAGGGWGIAESHIRFADGFAMGAPSPMPMVQLVMLCDGMRTAGDAIGALANATKQPVDKLGPQILAAMRGLVERGVLIPA
jgi:tRNA1(Val) A37 N6-methylase TrmN6